MKHIYSSVFFCLMVLSCKSQHIQTELNSFYGIWDTEKSGNFYGGGGVGISYHRPIGKGSAGVGLSWRFIDWGNQATIDFSYELPFVAANRKHLNGELTLGLGQALFRRAYLFAWSIGYAIKFEWDFKKRNALVIGLGLQYTNCPGYAEYGAINQVLEIPINIGIRFDLNQPKESSPN